MEVKRNLWVVTCNPTAKSEWVSRFSLTSDGYDLIADNYTYWWWIQVSWIGQNVSLGIMDWIYKFLNACQSSCIQDACKNLAHTAVLNTSPSQIYTRNSFPYHQEAIEVFLELIIWLLNTQIDNLVTEEESWRVIIDSMQLNWLGWLLSKFYSSGLKKPQAYITM